MIAGGKVDGETVSSAYILQLHFQPNSHDIIEVSFKNVPDMPIPNYRSFSQLCEGRSIIGGGLDSNCKALQNVGEFDVNEFKTIPLLKLSINPMIWMSGLNALIENKNARPKTPEP